MRLQINVEQFLFFGIRVARIADQDLVIVAIERIFNPGQNGAKYRIRQGRHQRHDHVRARRRQCTRSVVGNIAKLANGWFDAQAPFQRYLVRLVQGARSRHHGHTGPRCHFGQRDSATGAALGEG